MPDSAPKRRKLNHVPEADKDGLGDADGQSETTSDSGSEGEEQQVDVQPKPRQAITRKRSLPNTVGLTSDLLQLQVDGLLKELQRTRRKRLAAAEPYLRQLKSAIEALPDRPPTSPSEGERDIWQESKIAVPYPLSRPEKGAKYTVSFAKPSRINVVGGFALDTAFVEKRVVPTIDLAITIPASIFQEKDFLNYRYFVKRAFYLAYVAAGLSSHGDLGVSFQYEYQNGSLLQPVLVATPEEDNQFRVRIIVAAATDFASSKLLPGKSNIRQNAGTSELDSPIPTPTYNATIQSERGVEPYLKLLYSTKSVNGSFPNACTLLSVWLRQRGLGSSFEEGGFGPFEASVLLATLLRDGGPNHRPLLSSGYSHFQLFKAILHLLASRDLTLNPIMVGSTEIDIGAQDNALPLIWDGNNSMNILYKMSSASYASLRYWAHSSLAAFDSPAADQLNALFVRRCDQPELRYDDSFNLEINVSSADPSLDAEGVSKVVGFSWQVFRSLKQALGSRAILIEAIASRSSWALKNAHQSKQNKQVRVGLILDSTHLHRAVDRGPSAEEKEATAAFREFWGEKSDLRRFQDSSILESVVWEEGIDVPSIHRQIVDYIITRQFSRKPKYTSLDVFARDSGQDYAFNSLTTINGLWRSFEELRDVFRDLEQLPLQLRNFLPTSFFLTNSAENEARKQFLEVALQFEGSARWPDDVVAIQRTKIAFLAKIQSLLQSGKKQYRCQLVLENTARPLLNCAYLEISAASNYRFHVRIFHEREAVLLSDGLRRAASSGERQSLSDALAHFNRHFVRQPDHVQALRRLCLLNPLLSPTLMLFRKWCSAHLLDPHLSRELQELLVVRVFTQPVPFTAPASASLGFLRTLQSLASWDWWNEPLIVNMGDMSPALMKEAATRFEAWRKIDPGLNRTVVFAASDSDIDGTTWTQHSPSKAVASRLSALAAAAVARVDLQDLKGAYRDIFHTGLVDFDFVIHLAANYIGSTESSSETAVYKNLRPSEFNLGAGGQILRMFIQEITALYPDSLVLFHDFANRPFIVGVWNPCKPRQWKTTLPYSTIPGAKRNAFSIEDGPADTAAMVLALNRNAILNDLARLGGDLIARIEFKESQ